MKLSSELSRANTQTGDHCEWLTWGERHWGLVSDPPPDGPLQTGARASWRQESKARGSGPGKTQTSETRGKSEIGQRGSKAQWLGQVWLVFSLRLRSSVCEAVFSLLREFPLFLLKRNKYVKFEASGVFTFFLLRCKCVIIAWSLSRSCNTKHHSDLFTIKNTLDSRPRHGFIFQVSLPNGDNTSWGWKSVCKVPTFWSWSSSWETICIWTLAWAVLLSSNTCSTPMCFWNSVPSSQRASHPVHLHWPGVTHIIMSPLSVSHHYYRGCWCLAQGTHCHSCSCPECCYCQRWCHHSPSFPPSPSSWPLLSPVPWHHLGDFLILPTLPEKNNLILINENIKNI